MPFRIDELAGIDAAIRIIEVTALGYEARLSLLLARRGIELAEFNKWDKTPALYIGSVAFWENASFHGVITGGKWDKIQPRFPPR